MITVLGASGFVGSHLVQRLKETGLEYQAIARGDALPTGNLGNAIYCIGLTADFRSKPLETVDAHVCTLVDLLRRAEFDSFLYLSSTRLYLESKSTNESQQLFVKAPNPDDLYNMSKAMGESVVLNCKSNTRVARLSNVYGCDFTSDNFLSQLLRQVVAGERIVLQTARDSAKDYVNVSDVVNGLIQIATSGRERIYNVASGVNVSHRELETRLRSLRSCTIEFVPNSSVATFPQIDISRMRAEFSFAPSFVLDDLPDLIHCYERNHKGA